MNKTEILNRLDKSKFYREHIPSLKVNGGPEAKGLCPFHDDHTPSLSVNIETGLYHCPVCGAGGDVFTFYQKIMGVDFPTALRKLREMAGVIDTSVKPKVVATFEYKNENGKVLYIKERIEPGRNGRSKEFVFKHLENGKWTLGRGCDPILYNLPGVMKSKNVIVLEGEGKVDLLNSWGLTATCLDSGANSPIKDEYIQILEGMESVIVLPDNDEPGQNYACKIANALLGKVKDLKIVNLPELQAKEDVKDWAKTSGNTREKLLGIVENTAAWEPKECNKPDVSPVKIYNATDLGNCKRLVAQHGESIRYCYAWKKWLTWDGRVWRIDDSGQILRLGKDVVRRIYTEAENFVDSTERKKIAAWGIRSEDEKKLNSMVSLAKSEDGVPISPQEMDVSPYLLNCLNGAIDLRTGQLEAHNPKNFITKIIPVEYDPFATCERWIKFLGTIFNWNQGLINFLQRAVGYSLAGDISEQCLFLLFGVGANGKSTLLNIINSLLGDYAQTAMFDTFLAKKEERSVNNDVARMQGKRFVSAIESEGERRLSEVLIKQLTGGDTIAARFLFAEFFEFTPQFKIWLACNHKPIIKGTDYAIWRRIKLIPFHVTIPEADRDKQLAEKLQAELPGILAWAVQGCLEWQRGGLQTPDEVKQATNEYQGDMDAIQAFLDDRCFIKMESTDVKTVSGKLYEVYTNWCSENGETPLNNKSFGRRLTEKGFISKQSGGKRWLLGVGLTN